MKYPIKDDKLKNKDKTRNSLYLRRFFQESDIEFTSK